MTRGQIILIGGEKGGVGKSTITTNIAVEMSYRKAEVIIIDTDPQKTSINWIDRRNELIETDKLNLPRISGVSKDGNVKDIIKDFCNRTHSQYRIVAIVRAIIVVVNKAIWKLFRGFCSSVINKKKSGARMKKFKQKLDF